MVDKDLIDVVDKIKAIVTKPSPYAEIYKLPALLSEFGDKHVSLIEKEAEPIREDLQSDLLKVQEVLNLKDYADKFKDKFASLFNELKDKLDTSNEVAAVKNIRYESDALKTRCLNEIDQYEKKLLEEKLKQQKVDIPVDAPKGEVTVKAPVIKTHKNVSLRQITAGKTYTIETEKDVDEVLKMLKEKLMKELDADTVIKLLM